MAQLAIKGHATRGKEVIEILEMLGGRIKYTYNGDDDTAVYFIDGLYITAYKYKEINCEKYKEINCGKYKIFTLEEFLEKFPYKVGDRVKTIYGKIGIVSKPIWSNRDNCIRYELEADTDSFYFINELQPYKEEPMEEKENSVVINIEHKQLKVHSLRFDKTQLVINDEYELKQEGDTYYIVRKKIQYPKTYEECCKVLMGKTDFQDYSLLLTKLSTKINEASSISPEPPHITLINNFYKLLICLDAYWKIAGEEMGLGKPWKPDWTNNNEIKFIIGVSENEFIKGYNGIAQYILAFPTEEMRDAFLENFKDLIEDCKELL